MTIDVNPAINLPTIPLDQVNLILEGLGELPFKRVAALATVLRTSAENQIAEMHRAAKVVAEAAKDAADTVPGPAAE